MNDLLDISKIEAGELKLDLQGADILELVSQNVGLNRLIADEKNIDAKKVVDGHGGQISVHSVEGEGSTFKVTLPRT